MKIKSLIIFISLSISSIYAETAIALNNTVTGSLSTTVTSVNRSGAYAKYYTFTLQDPTEVTIDMVTSSFDTYLYLLSGNSRTGTAIASNDDGGTGSNSKITRVLQSGTYTIEATSYRSNKLGSFLIRVNALVTSSTLVTYFGEDLFGGRINSDNAKRRFLSNLTSAGTEDFESKTDGTSAPLNIDFGSSGTAIIRGSGYIETGETASNQKPTSGSKFWQAETGDFTINFTQPVSAFGFYATDVGDWGGSLILHYANNTTKTIYVGNTVVTDGSISGSILYYAFIEKDLSKAFTSITFTNNSSGDYFGFDDMTIANRAQINTNKYLVKNDFNKDGIADILWRNDNGQYLIYYMLANGSRGRYTYGYTIPNSWEIVGTNDFNGDNITDILWRHEDGQYLIFYMLANGSRGRYTYGSIVPTYYEVQDTNDFNKDGIADILWRNKNNGQYLIYFMNANGSRKGYKFGSKVPLYYTLEDTNDFNGDGIADILWRNKNNGQYLIYFMNADGSRKSYKYGSNVPLNYKFVDTNDFNGDGLSDILWRNKDNGQYLIFYMNAYGQRVRYAYGLTIPTSWKIVSTNDSNRDGIADILWRNKDNGQYLIFFMNADGSRKSYKYGYVIPNEWKIENK